MCCGSGKNGLLQFSKNQRATGDTRAIEHISYFNVIGRGYDKLYGIDAESLRTHSYICDADTVIVKIKN